MDELEKYISERRESLDLYQPDKRVWKRIESSSPGKRSLPLRRVSGWAAAVVIVMASAAMFMRYSAAGNILLSGKEGEPAELRETELYYTAKVNNLIREAEPLFTGNPSLGIELMDEMENLDSLYLAIKSDLKENVNNADVVEALITNYRTRIRILEEMVTILKEEDNNSKKGADHEL